MPAISDSEHYDRRTVLLHWLTATLVIALWSLGQTIDWFPRGMPRTSARSTHILLGLTLAVVVVYRLWWRSTGGRRLPPADRGWLAAAASAMHRLLYFGLCTTVVLGVMNAWIRGDKLFDLVAFPAYDPANKALRDTVENWHGLSANALVIVAAMHASAALMHHFFRQDGVLQRMRFDRHDR